MATTSNEMKAMPSQKVSDSKKKNLEWIKENLEAAKNLTGFDRLSAIRKSTEEKRTNYNLVNGELDQEDIKRICNPFQLEGVSFPQEIKNYSLITPKINLLTGEERKRRFDWRVRVGDFDAISEKENELKSQLFTLVSDMITEGSSEEDIQEKLKSFTKYANYSFQDLRELSANRILKYLWKTEDLKDKFSRGFEDLLIAGEEIFEVDIIAGEPVVNKLDPLSVYTVRSGNSPYIEDSDIIVINDYVPLGKIIDSYHDELKDTDIKSLEEGVSRSIKKGMSNYSTKFPALHSSMFSEGGDIKIIDIAEFNNELDADYNEFGDLRRTRVLWKSLRKVKRVKSFDEDGNEVFTIMPGNYTADESKGEETKTLWITEWMEATELPNGVVVKYGPRKVQLRSLDNPSICHPGIVGTAHNVNSSRSRSIVDVMKPYQYLYNVFMYRTELAFAKSFGKVMRLPLHEIPDGWTVDDWMYYATQFNIAVYDGFKESNRPSSIGQLAGNLNQNQMVLDMEMGNFIQQHVLMLNYLEQQIGSIAGVTKQREGQVENRELVGNVERSVFQSSHITEKWFSVHDNVKIRVLKTLLDTAKVAWKNKSKKLQYITDDLGTEIFTIVGSDIKESEFDIHVSNSSADTELHQILKSLAQAGLQNDKLNFSQLIKIYQTESISSIARQLETAEQEAIDRQSQLEQQTLQVQQEQIQANAQLEQEKINVEREKSIRDAETKLAVEAMKLNKEESSDDILLKSQIELKKLNEQMRQFDKEHDLEKRKQLEAERHNKKQEEIDKKKASQSNKAINK